MVKYLTMKKHVESISSPDELNKHLQYTSPVTWIVLGLTICILLGFFVWSYFARIVEKIKGIATIKDGEVTLVIDDSKKDKIVVGQKVYILEQVGEILEVNNGQPLVSSFNLDDGNYVYTIVVKEIRPIDFLIK